MSSLYVRFVSKINDTHQEIFATIVCSSYESNPDLSQDGDEVSGTSTYSYSRNYMN